MPQVSVVMGVYNGEQYLHASIESVLSQKGVDLEFIIVDDGSTDSTPVILKDFSERDPRIRVISQENQGLTLALIRGCSEASARYIARQDADDISVQSRLVKLLRLIESSERLSFVSSWATCIGPANEKAYEVTRPADWKEATHRLLKKREGPPAHGSVMFRKDAYELVGGYREQFYFGQDSDLWLRLAQHGQVAYVPEYLYRYLYSEEGISANKRDIQKRFGDLGQACHAARMNDESEEQWLRMAADLREEVLSGKVSRIGVRKRKAASNYFLGSGLYEQRNPQAARYFWEAIKSDPLHWRAWLKMFSSVVR